MKTQLKSILFGGLIGGIVYSVIMAGFDYYEGQNFRIWRFILNAIIFGLFMGILTRYHYLKQKP